MTDPFRARQQLGKMIQELRDLDGRPIASGAEPTGWCAPFLVNTYASDLMQRWNEFEKELNQLRSTKGLRMLLRRRRQSRDAKAHVELESGRIWRFGLLFENLLEKYNSALRTQALFQRIEREGLPFILLLREFTLRTNYFQSGSIGTTAASSSQERQFRCEHAKLIAPIPLVWVANPSDSGSLDTLALTESLEDDESYRVGLGSNWETDVESLIRAASYIIVYNHEMTPGISKEISLIRQLGRLTEAFFVSPDKAASTLGQEHCNSLDVSGLEQIRSSIGVTRSKIAPYQRPHLSGSLEMREIGLVRASTRVSVP